MLIRLLSLLFACVLSLSVADNAFAAADMFGRPDDGSARMEEAPPAASSLPAPLRAVLGRVVSAQSRLNAELRGQLREARGGESWRPVAAILLISFLYGVLHAVGPGHGKVVVSSYFVSRRARLLHGFAMSGSAAFVQSLSAVALVSILVLVLQLSSREILAQAATLETLSYVVITGLGLWMLRGVLSGADCCAAVEMSGQHHEHGDDCHHDHDHDHDHRPSVPSAERRELAKVLAAGAAVGLRPCSGAILVLLFTLANQIYPVGIAATFAMGLGVAITVALVSLTSLGIHRSVTRLGAGRSAAWSARLHRLTSFAGAAAITLFGALQLLGIWSGALTPMAG